MRRSGFPSVFLLLLPAAVTLAAPAPTPAAKPAAPAPAAKPAAPAPVQPAFFPEVLFRPLLRAKQDPRTFADPARAAELFLAREKLIQNLLAERRRILAADPRARELHAKIMELNKQLAVVLESKRAVRELTRDLMLVDARINALERTPVPAPAAKPAAPAPAAKPQTPAPAAPQPAAAQPANQNTAK